MGEDPVLLMLLICVSLGYCYSFVTKMSKALLRLIFVLPVLYLFSIFPWCFSSSTLRGIISYFITWIASFKLLLFCFHRGPLAHPNTTSFIDFLVLSILPLKIKDPVPSPDLDPMKKERHRVCQNPVGDGFGSQNLHLSELDKDRPRVCEIRLRDGYPNPPSSPSFQGTKSVMYMVSKYGAVLVKTLKRYEIVPIFNHPYMATSLQDFWGRRWNLLSSWILRLAVYDPTREALGGVVGVGPAKVAATVTTLMVSGVMHEVMFYHVTCGMRPTWEVTCFFVSHGCCMVLEARLKKRFGSGKEWSSARACLANALTLGFVLVTSYWLLVLPVWKNGQENCNERGT